MVLGNWGGDETYSVSIQRYYLRAMTLEAPVVLLPFLFPISCGGRN